VTDGIDSNRFREPSTKLGITKEKDVILPTAMAKTKTKDKGKMRGRENKEPRKEKRKKKKGNTYNSDEL